MDIVRWTSYGGHRTVDIVRRTLYVEHCTLDIVRWTLYVGHRTLDIYCDHMGAGRALVFRTYLTTPSQKPGGQADGKVYFL